MNKINRQLPVSLVQRWQGGELMPCHEINFPDLMKQIHNRKISEKASLFIAASRVDQALCDEAERGNPHGGFMYNGSWYTDDCMFKNNVSIPYYCYFDYNFQNSPPQICVHDVFNSTYIPTRFEFIRRKFVYLAMSMYNCILRKTPEEQNEIAKQQIKNLCAKFELDGKWGSKNWYHDDSDWYEDLSLMTTWADNNAKESISVMDHNGDINYNLEIISYLDGELVLPYCYLRKENVCTPRLFYAPPEDNIAIWYKNMPMKDTKEVVLTRNHILMQYLSEMGVVIGCLPGDTPSIKKTALNTLRGRKVHVIIVDENDVAEVNFAITLADKLRKEYIEVDIIRLTSTGAYVIDTPDLVALARKHDIFFPERLRSDYYGDITLRIKREEVKPLIHNVINADEAIFINTSNASKHLLASHIATKLGQGVNVFEQNWVVEQPHKSAVFIDQISKRCQEYYKSCDKICDCRFIEVSKDERMQHFAQAVGDAKVVLINSQDLIYLNTDICKEVIGKCLRKDIAVLLFGSEPLSVKLRELVSHTIMAESIERNSTLGIKIHNETDKDSIEIVFNDNGELQSVISYQEEINDYTDSATLVRSASPDFSKFKLNVANSDNSVYANNRDNFWNNF